MIRALFRGICMPMLILAFLGWSLAGRLVIRNTGKRRRFHAGTTSFFSGLGLRMLGIRVTIEGEGAATPPPVSLLVSNHLSYLDIMVLSAIHPSLFITSVEVRNTPFLGRMADMGGSLFIERRNRENIDREIANISEALREGHTVTLYPEGTSSDGRNVLPFKRSLIQAALDAPVPVQPVVLAYTAVNGEPFGDRNRDRVCWYADMSFLPHFVGLFTVRNVDVRLAFLSPIYPAPTDSRKDVCELAHLRISSTYGDMIAADNVPPESARHTIASELYLG